MISLIENWTGSFEIDGKKYDSSDALKSAHLNSSDICSIVLYPAKKQARKSSNTSVVEQTDDTEYAITVKAYMTREASPEFDFMAKFNTNVPMPLRTMVGKKIKETKGMVYMELHGDIVSELTTHCMRCGRKLTNPVSQYFGIGPECGNHNYVNPFDTDEELHEAVDRYKEQLRNIKWSGWVVKSSIIEEEIFNGRIN